LFEKFPFESLLLLLVLFAESELHLSGKPMRIVSLKIQLVSGDRRMHKGRVASEIRVGAGAVAVSPTLPRVATIG
jgi:hypothetical protein